MYPSARREWPAFYPVVNVYGVKIIQDQHSRKLNVWAGFCNFLTSEEQD